MASATPHHNRGIQISKATKTLYNHFAPPHLGVQYVSISGPEARYRGSAIQGLRLRPVIDSPGVALG
jgi:hypothetical protein